MNGSSRVLGIGESAQWMDYLKKMHLNDIHFEPRYYQFHNSTGEAKLFVYEGNTATIIYPFIIRDVCGLPGMSRDEHYFDITSPYGFGGPLYSTGTNQKDIEHFYYSFQQYCCDSRIISEFIRFHPLIKNHELMTDLVEVKRNSTIVYIDLQETIDEIWAGYHYSNRKNVNKARREGVSIIFDDSPRYFSEFISIYRQTMDRNQAGEFYYFDKTFFDRLHRYLKGSFVYAHAIKDNQIISTELLIHNGYYIHSFLGGTLAEYFPCRPNNLLKHELICWAKDQGFKYFVLGGGKTDHDGIFKYKRTFANKGLTGFYIGKKIHNDQLVDKLMEHLVPASQDSEKFPPYRR